LSVVVSGVPLNAGDADTKAKLTKWQAKGGGGALFSKCQLKTS